jgi:hypothetical protein
MLLKRKTKHIETTLKTLAQYHAVKLDNTQFVTQYRHLISMYLILCKKTKRTPIL